MAKGKKTKKITEGSTGKKKIILLDPEAHLRKPSKTS